MWKTDAIGNKHQIYHFSTMKKKKAYLPLLFLFLTFVSANNFSTHPIGSTAIVWILNTFILAALYYQKKENQTSFLNKSYLTVTAFLVIAVVGIVKGGFVADNYWEMKTLVADTFILMVPFCVYSFSSPSVIQKILNTWLKYALIPYLLFFFWVLSTSQFYLAPIYFVALFLPIIPKKKWQLIILAFVIGLLLYHYQDNRSQAIKAAVSLCFTFGCLIHKWLPNIFIKFLQISLFVVPCYFLYLGVTGTYNIFEEISYKYKGINKIEVETYDEDGNVIIVTSDAVDDSRTFIYEEVLLSAINNDYAIWGRTPARGNDTYFFYDQAMDLAGVKNVENIKNERSMNELCFLNIFTWLGLVGMVAYILIFLHASILAIYKSNSFYMKLIGLYIAFNFAYGWIENTTNFDIINFVYWMAISMALSPEFRKMSDDEFKKWFADIFDIKYKIHYESLAI